MSVPRNSRTPNEHEQLEAIGRAIRAARKAKDISQEFLANEANIDRSHMGKIERGERNVTALNIFRIADALKLKPSELFRSAEF